MGRFLQGCDRWLPSQSNLPDTFADTLRLIFIPLFDPILHRPHNLALRDLPTVVHNKFLAAPVARLEPRGTLAAALDRGDIRAGFGAFAFGAGDEFAHVEVLELLAAAALGAGFVVLAAAAGVLVAGGEAEEGGEVLADDGADGGDGAAKNAHVEFDDAPE